MNSALHTRNGGHRVDNGNVVSLDLHRIVAGKANPDSKPFAPGTVERHRRPISHGRCIAIGMAVVALIALSVWACMGADLSLIPSIHGLGR